MYGNQRWQEDHHFSSYYPYAYHGLPVANYYCYPPLWNYGYNTIPPILLSPQIENPVQVKPPSLDCSPPQENIVQSPQENSVQESSVQIENSGSEQGQVKGKKKVQRKVEKWRQKYGRNIHSNIFHMAIKKILSSHFNLTIKKIIEENKMEIKENQFLSKLNEKWRNLQTYISSKALQKIVVGSPSGSSKVDTEYKKILRTIIVIYLKYEHIPHIFSSGKIKKKSRLLHMSCIRKLIQQMGRE